MIEHEKKVLLSKCEYMCILNDVYEFGEEQIHINHYYDTDSFGYNDLGITCRVREKKGVYIATVKQHGAPETASEKSSYVKNEKDNSLFEGMNVKYFGSMKTERRETTPCKGVTIVLDRNEYLDTVDYELEIEYEAGYEKFAESLLDATATALFYGGLTEYREDIISRANTGPNKSQRFFRRFSELKFDRAAVSCKEQSQEFGDLAHGFIDVKSGTFKLVLDGIQFNGAQTPLNVRFIYNSDSEDHSDYKIRHLRGLSDFYTMKLGCGWKLDLMKTMVAEKVTYCGVEYDGYMFTNETGDKSFFIPTSDTGINDKECEEYIDLGDESCRYDAIARKLKTDEAVYWFDKSGRLCKVSDNDNNYLDITYIGDRIIGISDTNGNEIFLDYNLHSQIKAITTSDGKKSICSYDSSSGMLSSIVYPQGNSISLKYTDKRITCIELLDSEKNGIYKVEYFYKGNKVIKAEEFFFDENGESHSGVVSNYIYSESGERTVVYTTEMSYLDSGEQTSTINKYIYNFGKDERVISCYVYPVESWKCEDK